MQKKYRKRLANQLRAAVYDGMRLEKKPGFKVNMGVFCRPTEVPSTIGGFGHTPPPVKVCEFCLGGAYALMHMKAEQPAPGNWMFLNNSKAQYAAEIVDAIRVGKFENALRRLGVPDAFKERDDEHTRSAFDILWPNASNTLPWETYLKAADLLEGKATGA